MKLKRALAAIAAGTLGVALFASPVSAAGDPDIDDLLSFGGVIDVGNTGNLPLNKPIVGMAFDPDGSGYWEVGSDGGIFAYDAPFLGSEGGKAHNAPIVGMTAIDVGLDGNPGYYFVGSDGGVFAYNAPFLGSMGGKHLNSPIVGIAPDIADTDGNGGYYLVGADGGIFAYNAPFLGSQGGKSLNKPIVGMTTTVDGGYYFVASDGGVFAYGDADAPFLGSMGGKHLNSPIVGMAVDFEDADNDGGYYLVGADGGIFAYNAPFHGSVGGTDLGEGKHVTGIYTDTTGGPGYFMTVGRSSDNYCTLTEDFFNSELSDNPSDEELNDFRELAVKANTIAPDDSHDFWMAVIDWVDASLANDNDLSQEEQAIEDAIPAWVGDLGHRCGGDEGDVPSF